jgi:2-polyprenyl-6-methoxyphenol hydroxylase-like FAD-dependent oxidoreductase
VEAGPTGLTLACDLARRGVRLRIIDQAPEPFAGSRGKGLQPRSLEVLDDLGLVERVLAAGVRHLPYRDWQGRRRPQRSAWSCSDGQRRRRSPHSRLEVYQGAPHGLFLTHADRLRAPMGVSRPRGLG